MRVIDIDKMISDTITTKENVAEAIECAGIVKGKIDSFSGEYEFLSNFYPAKIVDKFNDITYPTVEHYFQAYKSLDINERIAISKLDTPGKAKRAGRHVVLREDWEEIKLDVMREALIQKFSNSDLKEKLLATGNAYLEEGNTWHDTFWGVCNGVGENHLGKILMEIRANIIKLQ